MRDETGEPGVARSEEGRPREHDDPPAAAEEVTVTACENGPLLVRGPFTLLTQDGRLIDPGRATVALCRCGRSSVKPFCDGSHKAARFRTGTEPQRPG
ncbi:CDGSH iron-sulfur domain-containing protein [Sphaerisporangium sp. NPDC005288]|uniref:CDGSH iron-sulfur domain-containing protein n=1 Tax=Sphaerisporangium sp. NPDC005288 TaxID=3155114 RepID=UPI0033BA939A